MLAILWIVVAFVAVIWIWPSVWESGVRNRIDCHVDFPRHECDIHEGIPLIITLVNRSFLPVPFAQVRVDLPDGLSGLPDREAPQINFGTYLLMRRRVQIQFTLYGCRRGPAQIKNISIRLHEGLGIRQVFVHTQPFANVFVRPDAEPYADASTLSTLQGERVFDRWLFPDETIFKGVRAYQEGDAARHIHWRASARLGQLVTKQFFSSTEREVLLLLNAQTTDPHWAGTIRAAFEQSCRFVTNTAQQLEKAGAHLSFGTNAVVMGQRGKYVLARMNSNSIRSALAHAHPFAGESLSSLLQHVIRHRHTTPPQIILFSAFETADQTRLIERIRRYGKQIHLVRPAAAIADEGQYPAKQRATNEHTGKELA